MAKLGVDTVSCIAQFLDLPSVFSFLRTQKRYYQYWTDSNLPDTILHRKQSCILTLNCDRSFSLDDCKGFKPLIWTDIHPKSPLQFLNSVIPKISQSWELPLIPLSASSSDEQYGQVISNTVSTRKYEFWSSAGAVSSEGEEYLQYQTADKRPAVILWVGVKLSQEYDYPPKQFRVKIGFKEDELNYVSEPIDANSTFEIQHFILLPCVVIGNFIQIDLIDKQKMYEPNQLYYVTVSKVTVVGIPAIDYETGLELASDWLRYPVSIELVQELIAKLVNFPDLCTNLALLELKRLNKTAQYFEALRTSLRPLTYCEIDFIAEHLDGNVDDLPQLSKVCDELADRLLSFGKAELAFEKYQMTQNYLQMSKCLLVLKRYDQCVCEARQNGSPSEEELIAIARSIGEEAVIGLTEKLQ